MENIYDLLFMILFFVSARGEDFDVQFRRSIPVHFPSKDEKDAVYKGRNGRKSVHFPLETAFFLCNYYD